MNYNSMTKKQLIVELQERDGHIDMLERQFKEEQNYANLMESSSDFHRGQLRKGAGLRAGHAGGWDSWIEQYILPNIKPNDRFSKGTAIRNALPLIKKASGNPYKFNTVQKKLNEYLKTH